MTVHIVTLNHSFEEVEIMGVFSTEEKAYAYIKTLDQSCQEVANVHTYVVV